MCRWAGLVGLAVVLSTGSAEGWFGTGERFVGLSHPSGTLEVRLIPDGKRAIRLTRETDHRWIFEGSTADLIGLPYSIELRNRSTERIKVVVGVDGLNVYRKAPIVGRADADTGSILSPRETRILRGWQLDGSTARRFVFSPAEWSEGEERTPARIGTLVVQVYRERPHEVFGLVDGDAGSAPEAMEREETMRKSMTRPQIGTTSGESVTSRVRTVSFDSLTVFPEAWVEIDYGRNGRRTEGQNIGSLGLSLGRDAEGVRILSVVPGSVGWDIGLRAGDVIVRLDADDHPTPRMVEGRFARSSEGRYVFLRVRRGRHELSFKIAP